MDSFEGSLMDTDNDLLKLALLAYTSTNKREYPPLLQSSVDALDNNLKLLLSQINKDTNLFHAAIFWKSPDGLMRSFITINIEYRELIRDFSGLFRATPRKASGAVGHSASMQRTILLKDLRRDDPARLYKSLPESGDRRDIGILCVPVLTTTSSNTDCLGAISITSLKPDIFTDDDGILVEKFIENNYVQLRCILVLLEFLSDDLYNPSYMVEHEAPQSIEQDIVDPFQNTADDLIKELRSNWRIPAEQHPTKFEQVITKILDNPSHSINFDELSPLFADNDTNPDHARDALINRLNVKLQQHGYRLEQPRCYTLVPNKPQESTDTK